MHTNAFFSFVYFYFTFISFFCFIVVVKINQKRSVSCCIQYLLLTYGLCDVNVEVGSLLKMHFDMCSCVFVFCAFGWFMCGVRRFYCHQRLNLFTFIVGVKHINMYNTVVNAVVKNAYIKKSRYIKHGLNALLHSICSTV